MDKKIISKLKKLKKFKTLDDIIDASILPKSAQKLLEKTDKNKSDIDRICSVLAKLLEK